MVVVAENSLDEREPDVGNFAWWLADKRFEFHSGSSIGSMVVLADLRFDSAQGR